MELTASAEPRGGTLLTTFAEWLQRELDERGWKQAELARQAQLSTQTVSMLLKKEGGRTPQAETCAAIAAALGIGPDEVMARAGLLPPAGEILPGVADLNRRLLLFREPERTAALRALDAMLRAIEQAHAGAQ